MEIRKIDKVLYNTANWQILSYLLQHPDRLIRGSYLAKALPHISKSAVYNAIGDLENIDVLVKEKESDGYTLNRSQPWLRQMMVTDSLITLQSLAQELSTISLKIILFGSRATGDYTSDSDYDLFVVSAKEKEVRRILAKHAMAEHIQLLLKTPEEWIDLHRVEPELYQSLQQGIVLWDQK